MIRRFGKRIGFVTTFTVMSLFVAAYGPNGSAEESTKQTCQFSSRSHVATSEHLVSLAHVWYKEGIGHQPRLGAVVSTAGDVNGDGYSDILVGEPHDAEDTSFMAHISVFLSSASGIETDASFIVKPSQLGALFGYSVDCAGDVNGDGYDDIVAGAPLWNINGPKAGLAVLYYGSSNGLEETRSTTLDAGQQGAQFGFGVSSAGDINGDGYNDLLIGAPYYEQDQPDEGAAFLYMGGPEGISDSPAWSAVSGQAHSSFGWSVSNAGDIDGDGYGDVIVGAPYFDGDAQNGGAVFVYHGSVTGLATEPNWVFTGDTADMRLGQTVSTAGDVNGDGYSDVLGGAPNYDPTGIHQPDGRVYLFFGSPSGLTQSISKILSHLADSQFGWSLADAGDIDGDGCSEIVIGTKYYYTYTELLDAAMLYKGSPFGPGDTPTQIIINSKHSGPQPHHIDMSVASAGDVNGDGCSDLIVGDENFNNFCGQAWVYLGEPGRASMTTETKWSTEGSEPNACFGSSVSSGDWNADGWTDLLVGAYLHSNGLEDAGAAFVYFGGEGGFASQVGWRANGKQAGEWFGYAVANAGDIDGDGYDDIIVGSPHYSYREKDEGAVFIFTGSGDGPGEVPTWTVEGGLPSSGFGYAVDRVGDVNGDGYSDVIVGAPRVSNGEEEEGRVYVFYGSPYGLHHHYAWRAEGEQAGCWFGYSVSGAGDINFDGYSDVLIGVPYYDNGFPDEGAVFVYLGSDTGLAAQPASVLEIDVENALFGFDVASAGDVNGDARNDILVGTGGENLILNNTGYAFVYLGDNQGVEGTPHWSAMGGTHSGSLGRVVAGLGDVDGDGYSDVLIGDPLYDNDHTNAGRVLMFNGATGGMSRRAAWSAEGDSANAWFGHVLTPLGDANGDGFYDFGVGAPRHGKTTASAGAVYLYQTNAPILPLVVPEQVRADSSRIGLLGFSEARDEFWLKVRVRIPPGASRLYLQWQVGYPLYPSYALPVMSGSVHRVHRPIEPGGAVYADLVEPVHGPYGQFARWRVRVATDLPTQPYTKWFYHPANPTNESTVRFGFAPEVPPPPADTLPPPADEPAAYGLFFNPAYPNPFKQSTTVRFTLPEKGMVDIMIYNIAGERVRQLLREVCGRGPQTVLWNSENENGQRVASGIYLIRLLYKNQMIVRKMVLIR